jgi:hypothetical protein
MIFYVGTDHPSWLWKEPIKYPLFISNRALSRYKSFKPADKAWSLDSGGFTELNMYGTWVTTPEQYIQQIRRYINEIGYLNWAAPQDWMCEPQVLKKTGFTVPEHQLLTVQNFQLLRDLALRPVQRIVRELFDDGIKMHGFGVKSDGLPAIGDFLASSDSMAWSFTARREDRNLCGIPHVSPRCHHCRKWATMWADKTTAKIGSSPVQLEFAYN